jgi:hypothetical protein
MALGCHQNSGKESFMKLPILVTCFVMFASQAFAQTPQRGSQPPSSAEKVMTQLAGTWRMVGTQQRMSDGTTRPDPDLGPNPIGYLMFDAVAGQMCTVVNNGDRTKWKDAGHPTDAEAQGIWNHTVSYCGSWSVDLTAHALVYRIEANSSPNILGTERRRAFTLVGDRLILRPTPLPPGVTEWTVEWRRPRGPSDPPK